MSLCIHTRHPKKKEKPAARFAAHFEGYEVSSAVTVGYLNASRPTTSPLAPFRLKTALLEQSAYVLITVMAPNTTPTKRAKVCVMRAAGYSNDEIRAALIDRHDLSNRQICRIVKRYGEKENYYEVGHSTGRPRKLTPREMRIACRHLANQTAHDASDLQRKYFPEVSVDTIKRALRGEGLRPHIRRTVPYIPHKNLHVRKSWAEERLEWTVNNWRAVTFSDESLDPRFTKKKVKHGGGKVTIWGMITAHGVGHIVRIEGNLNKELYCEILQDDVLGTFRDLHLDFHNYYFQQDNDPKHTAKLVQAWFRENDIDLLPWPPNSPDISIIENLWDHLDRRIRARNPLPCSESDLWIALQEEWYKIDVSFIENLYASLPQRISAVYLANGGSTRY